MIYLIFLLMKYNNNNNKKEDITRRRILNTKFSFLVFIFQNQYLTIVIKIKRAVKFYKLYFQLEN